MAKHSEESFHLRVRDSGSLEIPADIVGRLGLAPGTAVTLQLSDGRLEIGRREADEQFVSWRAISHDLLKKSAA